MCRTRCNDENSRDHERDREMNITCENDNFGIRRIVNGLILGEITFQEAMDGIIWVKTEKLSSRLERDKDAN